MEMEVEIESEMEMETEKVETRQQTGLQPMLGPSIDSKVLEINLLNRILEPSTGAYTEERLQRGPMGGGGFIAKTLTCLLSQTPYFRRSASIHVSPHLSTLACLAM